MSPRQRIVLLALAAVVLVAGIVLAASSGGDDSSSSPTTPTSARTAPADDGAPTETQAEEPPPKPEPRVETIRMRDRAPVGEPATLRFERGETIRLRFTSDVAEEVHIHGFDRYVQVPAGKAKTERFEANLEGIFEVEAHSTGEILAKLEIRPQ